MGQILHGGAKTTHAVRAAIQRSKATIAQLSGQYDLNPKTVVKWSRRYRATGGVAPGKTGGHRRPILEPHRAVIIERITQTPRPTLHGLKNELAARGIMVSHNAVRLLLRREGLRFKKNSARH